MNALVFPLGYDRIGSKGGKANAGTETEACDGIRNASLSLCHKIKRNVQILEDYEVIDGVRTLVRCSCPVHMGTASTDRHCNGINEFDFPCGYADWQQTK